MTQSELLENLFEDIADAIRIKRSINNKIVASNFPKEILKILDVYSSIGIAYSMERSCLSINKIQIGSYPKNKFNGYQIADSLNIEIKEKINTKDYLILGNPLYLQLEVIEDE